ncbi:MAG: HEAT repeat domain-containing protein, partial [Thermoanaerobaculia bacterium]
MMRRIGHLTLAVGILLSWCGDLSCAVPIPPKGPQEQYAVFIGVDDPSAPAPVVPRLRHIADVVSNQYGYRRSNIVEIYNEKASLDSIRQAVGRISSAVSPSDSLFVVVALPTAHTADDVVAVPFNGDPAKPWTVLFTNDFAQWFAKNTAGQIAAIFPACAGHSKASFYAFEELRYTRSRMGTMQIASVCEESGPGPMSNLIDLLSNALSSSTGRLDLTGVMETAPAKIGQLSVIDVGELRPFYFTPQQNKLQPLIDVVKNGTDSKRRVSAIQEIVAAVNAEPTDRRATLVAAASAPLAATIGDADKSVRLTAIWAAGIVGLTSLSPRLASQFLSTNDEDEKRAIITALNNLKSGEVLSVIRRGLEDQSAAVRIATLRAGSVVRDDAVAKRTLSLGTGDPDPAVRAAVLQVLPGMSVPDQVKIQTTESALNDPSAIVRRQAVATWAELKQPATPALLTMLQSDPDSDVRQAVAYAIGRVQLDPANLDTVVTRLTTVVQSPKQQTRVREAAAWSLGRVG